MTDPFPKNYDQRVYKNRFLDSIKNKDSDRTYDEATDALEAIRDAIDAGMVVLQSDTRAMIVFPSEVEIPESGTTNYRLYLYLYDTTGEMEAPDSAPTITIIDSSGAEEVAETPMTNVDTGRYYYTVAIVNTETPENWIAHIKVIESGDTRYYGAGFDLVQDSVGSKNDTTTDTIHGKLGTDTEMADSSFYDMLTALSLLVDDLEGRLTAARAGYLDNINNSNLATIGDISSLTATIIGYINNTNLSTIVDISTLNSTIIGYLNNANLGTIADISTFTSTKIGYLDAAITSRAPPNEYDTQLDQNLSGRWRK